MDAYAAGLIDGEGYIGIVKAGGYFQVRVKVEMTDKGRPALERMRRHYGGTIHTAAATDPTRRQTASWRLSGKSAIRFLEIVRPHLAVKEQPAIIALQLGELMNSNLHPNGMTCWTDGMVRQAEVLRGRIQDANRRGPDPVVPPGRPIAIRRWGEWWQPDEDLFGPVMYSGSFPTSGRMVDGYILPLPASERRTDDSECSSSPGRNLATPTAAIAVGGPPQDSRGKRDLRLDLLPTPTVSDTNGPGAHGDGGADLRTAVMLLPTPRAQNGEERNQNIWARSLDQPQNLENALARIGDSLSQPSDVGSD